MLIDGDHTPVMAFQGCREAFSPRPGWVFLLGRRCPGVDWGLFLYQANDSMLSSKHTVLAAAATAGDPIFVSVLQPDLEAAWRARHLFLPLHS